jgi:hypothetical protein
MPIMQKSQAFIAESAEKTDYHLFFVRSETKRLAQSPGILSKT